MARRVQRHQLQAADLKRGVFLDAHVGAGQLVDGRACDTAAGFPLQFQRRGDVIGMYVRIERKRQLQAEARQFGQIALHRGNDRVNQHCLSGFFAAQQIGVGRGNGLE